MSSTSRTLLISDIFPPKTGGSGRWFREIYGRLSREEYVIAVGHDARQAEYDKTHDLDLVRLPLELRSWGVRSVEGLQGYWRSIRALLSLVKSRQVGMVHAGRCLPEGVMALAIREWAGIPYACYAHGEDIAGALTSRELAWLARRVLRGAEFVIANSRNTEGLLADGWGLEPRRVRLMHPGVDTSRFIPKDRDPGVRARLGWGDRPVVLTVGRLQKRKGHDQMILALGRVRRVIPDVLYAIVGGGEEREALGDLVADGGMGDHVQFLEELDDELLICCYQQCDLFALPNRQVGRDIEGFGMVLLEAQACGKPVIAGSSGGTAETMRVPETGRLVACDGPAELAEAVIQLLSNREGLARMGRAGRLWAVEQFDWQALARRAEELFRGGAGAAPPHPFGGPAR